MNDDTETILQRTQDAFAICKDRYQHLPDTHALQIEMKKLESYINYYREEASNEKISYAWNEVIEAHFFFVNQSLTFPAGRNNTTIEEVFKRVQGVNQKISKLSNAVVVRKI
jgi:hypothetical protein